MNDNAERILESLTPRGAPARLREDVLQAVAAELATTQPLPARRARWDVRVGAAVAAALMLGVVLNVWAIRSDDIRQAQLYGPRPLPREIDDTVEIAEWAAGPECADLVRQRLTSAWQARRQRDALAVFRYHQQFMLLVLTEKGITDAEIPQVDRHRLGQPDRSAFDCQRHLRLA